MSSALPTWASSTLMISQRGRNTGGPGVAGRVRRFTSISALPTVPLDTRIVCSMSGAQSDARLDGFEFQMHQVVLDLDTLDVQPAWPPCR